MTPRQRNKNLPSTVQSSLFPPIVNQHFGRGTAKNAKQTELTSVLTLFVSLRLRGESPRWPGAA